MSSKMLDVDYSPIDDDLVQKALAMTEYFYGVIADFPEDEKWGSASKIRGAALDLLFSVAQGVGNASPSSREYDWGNVRRAALSLKAMYRFAHNQHFVDIDPQIMLQLEEILKHTEEQLIQAYAQTKGRDERDLELRRKRYDITTDGKKEFQE